MTESIQMKIDIQNTLEKYIENIIKTYIEEIVTRMGSNSTPDDDDDGIEENEGRIRFYICRF
jgi:hypothetical protein